MVGRSRIVLVKGWNARKLGPGRWIGRIGGFGGCRVVVVVVAVVGGSIGPWRQGMEIWRRQCCLLQFPTSEARKTMVVICDVAMLEALIA